MNGKVRLNKVIELLEQGKTVFGALVRNGNLDDVLELGDSDYDFCYIEMEHDGFSFIDLRNSLQHFISRKRSTRREAFSPMWSPWCAFLPTAVKVGTTSGLSNRALTPEYMGWSFPT